MMIRFYLFLMMPALLIGGCKPYPPRAETATPQQIKQTIEASKAPLTLVHIWATWCDPCREEFPELVQVIHRFPSLEVILISADDPQETTPIEAFLVEYECPVDTLVSTELSQAFIESISPKWGGALPASFLIQDGRIVSEWEGKRTFDQFKEIIEMLLNK